MQKRHRDVPSPQDLKRWATVLNSHKENLIRANAEDLGRSFEESTWLEWAQVESTLTFLKRNLYKIVDSKKIKSAFPFFLGRRRIRQRRIPVGRVLVIGTWNFPLGLHLPQILFCIAAGNSVVFKPSPFALKTAKAVQVALGTLFDEEKFKLWLPEKNEEVTLKIKERAFDLVLFTGGTGAAKILALACAESLTPFIPEASGLESTLLTKDGAQRFSEHADHLLWATFHNGGQTCISPRFWFVPEEEVENVWQQVQKEAASISAELINLRPQLRNDAVAKEHKIFKEWVEKIPGATIISFNQKNDFYLGKIKNLKSLSTRTPPTFGPMAVIVGYTSIKDAAQWILETPWSLMTTVFGHATHAEKEVIDSLDTSLVTFNESIVSAGDAAVPFGGRSSSGYGVCRGEEGFMHMTRVQTWVEVKPWLGLRKLLIRPGFKTIGLLNKLTKIQHFGFRGFDK